MSTNSDTFVKRLQSMSPLPIPTVIESCSSVALVIEGTASSAQALQERLGLDPSLSTTALVEASTRSRLQARLSPVSALLLFRRAFRFISLTDVG
ncbi:hypothetical protein GOP47_0005514 [Adiantum capillus-veneris]|uniref:Uncharacterized protein n=1 Tax=Adiantum capillus-veneris TaxID=13818 RepID=A0A9D4ZP72_ADICA|nr:hypothetical protein GOP47_0005514 [Adiantum capillus-veneris]